MKAFFNCTRRYSCCCVRADNSSHHELGVTFFDAPSALSALQYPKPALVGPGRSLPPCAWSCVCATAELLSS